ncbi:MAG: putative quinol monooxygenase [Erythrobacter sp.]|nr:putative quinol monooxygenase [Erythrobacter sp.]
MSAGSELLVVGTFRIRAETIEAARPEMERMIAASRAEEGCLGYNYAFDLTDETLVHVIERWRDRAALEAHFASAHLLHWRARFAELGITDRRLIALVSSGAEPV